MSFLGDFAEWQTATIRITSLGDPTGVDEAGRPTYGAPVVKHDAAGWAWQLSASEQLVCDRMGNPSTHRIVLDPANVTGTIEPEDECEIDGEAFALHRAEDLFKLGELITFTAERKR